jgi:hypothetical protein
MALLSSMLSAVHDALASRRAVVQLDHFDVPLDQLPNVPDSQPFAVMFEGPGPHSSAAVSAPCKRALADFLCQQTRRVAIRSPPLGIVIEAALRCACWRCSECCKALHCEY